MPMSNITIRKGILAAVAVTACGAAQAADPAATSAPPIRIEIQSIPLATTPQGRIATAGDSRSADMAVIDPGIITVSGYEVLPNGEVIVSCRQTTPVVSLQGAVLERRVGKEILR